MVDGLPLFSRLCPHKKKLKTQRIMKDGRIIFFGPIRQTDSNLNLMKKIKITTQSLKAGVHLKAVLTSLNTAFLPKSWSRLKQR